MKHEAIELCANYGFSIIPLKANSKVPAIDKWKDYQQRHPTLEELNAWFDQKHFENIAIVTGAVSGIVVLDVDGEEGEATLSQMGDMQKTPTVRTAKGYHFYFRHPGGRVSNQVRLLPGLDIRADGGYVVAPPSVHESGHRYHWVTRLDEVPLAEIPKWLIDLLRPQSPFEPEASETLPAPVDWEKERPRVQDALRSIPASIDWQTWREDVLKPLCDASGGNEDCYAMLDEWACTCEKYATDKARTENRRQWEILKRRERQEHLEKKRRIGSFYALASKYGWHGWQPVTLREDIPLATDINDGGLGRRAIESVRQAFAGYDPVHSPSVAQWLALRELAARLEAMAEGKAESVYYLSSLDPGVGKTQTIAHFIKTLQTAEHDAGAIIFVSFRREIKAFIKEMGLSNNDFAVQVSTSKDDKEAVELNGLGNPKKDDARVLLTTQQMLETLTKSGRTFGDLKVFHYHGKPRAVRVWDEQCLPARKLMLDVEIIQNLETRARKIGQTGLADTIEKGITAIRNGGEFITLPELPEDDELLGQIYSAKGNLREAIFDLKILGGRTVNVVRDGRNRTLVHFTATLPDDITPMVITDASGRVRQTYPEWARVRGNLVVLQSATKDYANLTINLWERSSSKSAWRDNRPELTNGIVSAIHDKPDDEEWLIVHPLPFIAWTPCGDVEINIPRILRSHVTNPERLKFIHWGGTEFRATNEFRHIDNVLLAGTYFLPEPAYHALTRASLGLPSDTKIELEVLRRIKHGEHANNILQAVCRGSARYSRDDGCRKCSVYIIADKGSGIPSMLHDGSIFPGAQVETWLPEGTVIKGKVGEALVIIDAHFGSETSDLPVSVLLGRMGMARDNFRKRVLKDRTFREGLRQRGLISLPGHRGRPPMIVRQRNKEEDRGPIELPF